MIADGLYIILGYLLVINLLTFLLFGVDKHRAQRNGTHLKQRRRVPESTLMLVALLGGSLGALIGMYTFRHKTQHLKFILLLPLILLIQVAIGAYWLYLSL